MPLQLGTGVAELDHTDWLTPGEPLFVEFLGTLLVVSIAGLNVTLQNLQDGAGAYPNNAAPGTVAPTTVRVTPTGFEGAAGSIGGGPAGGDLQGTYPNPTLKNTGTAGTTGDATHVARITTDTAGRVTAATAVPIAFPPTVIPSGVLNAQYAPNDGNLVNGEVLFATATGQQTKTAANAKLALGINGQVGNYVLIQNQQPNNTSGGSIVSGSWVVVPFNTKVSDPGGIATLAANVLALPNGAYRIYAAVLGYKVGTYQTRLFNISDAVVEFYGGTVVDPGITNLLTSILVGRIIVSAGPKNYRIEARSSASEATDGFGVAAGFGNTEVFSSWWLEQEV